MDCYPVNILSNVSHYKWHDATLALSFIHLFFYSSVDMMSSLYDIIVIDPPWENRSAIRGKK